MFRAFLQLIRLPNFLTVPGDILVGGLIAAGGDFSLRRFWAGILASLCFYGFGIVLNDVMDAKIDRKERPGRPIPSGAIPRAAAVAIAVAFCAAGFAVLFFASNAAALRIGGALCVLIAAYNFGLKRIPLIGVLTMGGCRACNVMLGFAAVDPQAGPFLFYLTLLAGVLIGTYIFALSALALREADSGVKPGIERFLPVAAFALLFGLWMRHAIFPLPVMLTGAAIAAFLLFVCWRAGRGVPLPRAIGQLLLGLILIQAWLCAIESGMLAFPALALLGAAALFTILTRYFYAS